MWDLEGEYLENCNCDLFCPCLLGPREPKSNFPVARPTEGHCDILAGFHIERGRFDEVTLDGLNVALTIHTPGVMGAGNWEVAVYLDAAGSPAQQSALRRVFYGEAGGPMSRVALLVKDWKEAGSVPIIWRRDRFVRCLEIPNVLYVEVEGLLGADGKTEVWLQNVKHMACRAMASAIGRRSWFRDRGASWDHTGKNGHYGPFQWSVA